MNPEKIRIARNILTDEQRSYLRRRGWEYRCDNPASMWLWQKALPDGRTVCVAQDTALTMQERADAISRDFWPKKLKATPKEDPNA